MSNNLPFRHILVVEDEKSRRIVSLEETVYSLGRDSSNAIVIYDRQVSRVHATLLQEEDTGNGQSLYKVIDGDLRGNISTNGVVVNGKPCSSHILKHGDVLRFGEKSKALYYILSDPSVINLFREDSEITDQVSSFSQKVTRVESKSDLNQENFRTTVTSNQELEDMSQKELIRLASFPELSPNPIIEINWSGEITYINPAASLKFKEIYQKQTRHPILAGLTDNCQSKHGSLFVREVKIGNEVFEQYVHYLSENKLIRSYVFDFTKRKQVEAVLRESERLYRTLLRQSFAGTILVDVKTHKILEANQSYCNLVGYSLEEILGMTLDDLIIFKEETSPENIYKILQSKQEMVIESEHLDKNKNRLKLQLNVTMLTARKKEIFCLSVNPVKENLSPQASHREPLTDLYNQNFLKEHLSITISNAENYKHKIGLIVLDIVSFQEINNQYGEEVANYCLKEIGNRLKICQKYGAIPIHSGNSKFSILLPIIDSFKETAQLSQILLENLQQPITVNSENEEDLSTVEQEYEIKIQIGLGIVIYPSDGQDFDTLWRNAETALSRSLENGGNNYQFYSATMTSRAHRKLRIEELLKKALYNQGLFLAYQPIVNLRSGMITGMEALLRWHNLELQRIPPSTLIGIAEEMGLIVPIGEWVLKAACTQNYIWQQDNISNIPISVNLSSLQFHNPNLATTVARILQTTKLEPHWLELEITEQTIMENSDAVFKVLRSLLQMGVQIAIDGFGSHYCSLNYLKKFPFHTLKLDQSFISELQDNSRGTAVIAAMIGLGESFNMRVVAKGVEKIQQLKLLRRLECQEMQGYLFSEPLMSNDATNVLKRGNVNYLIP